MKRKLINTMILSSLLVVSCSNSHLSNAISNSNIQITKESMVEKNSLQLPNFAGLVKSVGATVVNIAAETPVQNNSIDMDPFFDLFRQFGQQVPQPKSQTQIKTSMGSGFVISKDGYILTNSHVVDGAKKIIVRTSNKQELSAKLIGQDEKTDIALLKVNTTGLEPVKIGNPDKLEVGEWVAAIGAPFGFDNSVTQGIVSAKGRSISGNNMVPFIQTDVPINPGNSGGPLFNLNGEVVGINSQIYTRSGGYMGISFSIPIDIAVNIANQLKKYGKASHGALGVQIQGVTQQLAQSFGLKSPSGALVAQVLPNSAAEKAGLKTGDIIIKVDDKEIKDANLLPLIIGSKKPSDVVVLTVFRNKQDIKIKVILGGDDNSINSKDNKDGNTESSKTIKLDKFGLTILNLDNNTKKQFNISNGVVVIKVDNIAQMSGIQEGDIILSVNNREIRNINQVQDILKGKDMAAFLILRNNQRMYITITVGQ